MMETVIGVVIAATVIAVVLWLIFRDVPKAADPEAPYKLEPQEQTGGYPPLDMAFPYKPAHEAIKWTYANAPKPKRKYTKRSKYWTKKSKAAKKTKTKRKSK